MSHHRLRGKEHALEVDVEHEVVILLGYVPEVGTAFQTGVVDQDVGCPEALKYGRDEVLCLRGVADVSLHSQCSARSSRCRSFPRNSRYHFFGAAAIGTIAEGDVSALCSKPQCDAAADALVPAGDDGDLAF